MLVVLRHIELAVALDHSDGHTVRELSWHHHVVVDLYPVHELVELCRKVSQRVRAYAGKNLSEMGQDRLTAIHCG